MTIQESKWIPLGYKETRDANLLRKKNFERWQARHLLLNLHTINSSAFQIIACKRLPLQVFMDPEERITFEMMWGAEQSMKTYSPAEDEHKETQSINQTEGERITAQMKANWQTKAHASYCLSISDSELLYS